MGDEHNSFQQVYISAADKIGGEPLLYFDLVDGRAVFRGLSMTPVPFPPPEQESALLESEELDILLEQFQNGGDDEPATPPETGDAFPESEDLSAFLEQFRDHGGTAGG